MRYLIAGAGAAGIAAAAQLDRLASASDEVVVLEAGSAPQPSKVLWPEYAASSVAAEAFSSSSPVARRCAEQRYQVRTGTRLAAFSPERHLALLETGLRMEYDRLLLATGMPGVRPHLPGKDGPGAYDLASLADAESIRQAVSGLAADDPVVVVGGGAAGIRLAEGIAHAGRPVTLCEMQPTILPGVLPADLAREAVAALNTAGVRVVTGFRATMLIRDASGAPAHLRCRRVRGSEAIDLPCRLLAICAGLDLTSATAGGRDGNPDGQWVDPAGPLSVDAAMRTQWPDVFAAGDIALPPGWAKPPGLWALGVWQGRQAAMGMACREGLPLPVRAVLTVKVGKKLLVAASSYATGDGGLSTWKVLFVDPAGYDPAGEPARLFEVI